MKALATLAILLLFTSCVTTQEPPPPEPQPPIQKPGAQPEPAPAPQPKPKPRPAPAEPIGPPPSFIGSPSAQPPIPEPPSPLVVARERLTSLTDQVAEQERLVKELRDRNSPDLEPRIRLRLETELLAELRRLDDLRNALRSHQRLVERLGDQE